MAKAQNKSEKTTYSQNPRSQRKKHQETSVSNTVSKLQMLYEVGT